MKIVRRYVEEKLDLNVEYVRDKDFKKLVDDYYSAQEEKPKKKASTPSVDAGPEDALHRYEVLDTNFAKYLSSDVCTGHRKRVHASNALAEAMDEDNCITLRGWVLGINPEGGSSTYAMVRRIITSAPKAFKRID